MNRKDYKRMYVWNGDRPKIPHKRVVLWSDETSCIAVDGDWEEEFLSNQILRTRQWQNCEEIPETRKLPFGKFWDYDKDKDNGCIWGYYDATVAGSERYPFNSSAGGEFQHFEEGMPEPYLEVSDERA